MNGIIDKEVTLTMDEEMVVLTISILADKPGRHRKRHKASGQVCVEQSAILRDLGKHGTDFEGRTRREVLGDLVSKGVFRVIEQQQLQTGSGHARVRTWRYYLPDHNYDAARAYMREWGLEAGLY